MKSIEETIKGRRSVRKYKPDPVKDETILDLLELATYAPSAGLAFGKEHPWSFVVIKDKVMLNRLSDVAKAYTLKFIENVPAFDWFRPSCQDPHYHLYYHAPALVMILGEKGSPISLIDCVLAAENFMLAAHAQGLGTCWVEWTKQAAQDKALMAELGIPEGLVIHASIVLGYPDEIPAAPERRPPHVIKWAR
ncbi:MAG: nitroreductase family protein [Candidatus Aminicenantes bacterium]|nr:nitroreductase family protein [Candidatus Aminicenantes bacterium]